MATYSQLAAQLGNVRWAWKRTAALAGLAIVSIEALMIFSLLLLIDAVYCPEPTTRMAISLAGLAALLLLVLWHVLRPMLRRIPDSQLALYVEEHNERFEGALMTATEFGAPGDGNLFLSPKIAQVILDAAAQRTEREDPRRAVVLTRLKKYALWAVAVVVVYAASFVTFHDQVATSARHVLVPLKVTVEETRQKEERAGRPAAPKPIELQLSAIAPPLRHDGSLRVPRGGSVELEVVLSRNPEQPVYLNYRVAASDDAAATAPLQRIEMQGIDKIDTYAVALKDIDTDLEIFASTGPYQSASHHVGVYEPLVLHGVEIAVQYPAYMQLPDRVEVQADGDVVAPVGAKVTVRFVTNRPLRAAAITWADSQKQAAQPDPSKPQIAAFAFDVTADSTYRFVLEDVDGQQIGSPSPCVVHAVPDEPPTIALQTPATSPLPLHPLGEINFVAEAADDFGLSGVELVYLAQTDIDAKEVRLPLEMQLPDGKLPAGRLPVRCTVRLAMENIEPRLPPGTIISYYLEARDRNPRGRPAVTKLAFISLLPFELWGTVGGPHPPEDSKIPEKTLDELMRGVWELHSQREILPREEFQRQCDMWANWMLDEQTGKVLALVVLPHGIKQTPDKLRHLKKGNDYCIQAHAALKDDDTGRAVRLLRFAMGEQAAIEFATTASAAVGGDGGGSHAAATLLSLRVEADMLAKLDQPDKTSSKEDAEAAKEAKKEASGMKQEQEKIIKKAGGQKSEEKEENKAEADPSDPHKPADDKADKSNAQKSDDHKKDGSDKSDAKRDDAKQPGEKKTDAEKGGQKKADAEKAAEKKPAAGKEKQKELAAEQTALAARAKAAAVSIRQTGSEKLAKVADKFDQASHKMTQAAELFARGETFRGLDRAKDAKTALEKAEDELGGAEQGGMEAEVSGLQDRAQRISRQQRDLRAKVEQVAADMPDGAAPNAQQDRDLKAALSGQLRLKIELEKFSADLAELDNHAKRAAKRETAKFVADALREMKRGRADQKAANAVVEVTASRPAAAAHEQKVVEDVMQKVATGLENAENTFASDWKSEARRAKREATAVRRSIEAIDSHQRASASAPDRKEQAAETAEQARRLAGHVTNRDLAAKDDAEALATMTSKPAQLATDLNENEQKRTVLAEIVKRISNHIEAEMQARVDAEKLFSAQREECPPQYRDMVNKYYEALSKVRKP